MAKPLGLSSWRLVGKEGLSYRIIWGLPKISGTILGVPIIRTTVFWGLYWGLPILGNYHIGLL